MTNAPKQTPTPPKPSRLMLILRTVLGYILHNWPAKLLALVLATVLWAVVLAQDASLTRVKTFNDVTVEILNQDVLKRRGYIVTDGLEVFQGGSTLRANVSQSLYDAVTIETYRPRLDLSTIRSAGTHEINVTTNNSSAVIEVDPGSTVVTVEEYVSRSRIPINIVSSGEIAEGFYVGNASADPTLVTVSGPKSVVDRVSRVLVNNDLSNLPQQEGAVRSALPFTLCDVYGEVIDHPLLEITTSQNVLLTSILVEQTVYATSDLAVPTEYMLTGVPAEGYEVKQVSVTPSAVRAAGKAENLSVLSALFNNTTVDVSGRSESFFTTVKLRKPSELVALLPDSVTVEVEIGPVMKSRNYSNIRVNLQGVPEGLSASMEVRNVTVTITGPSLWLDKLKSNEITLMCDASGLQAGSYQLPVLCSVLNAPQDLCTMEVQPTTLSVVLSE